MNTLPPNDAAALRESIASGGCDVSAFLERTHSLRHAKRRADTLARAASRELECLPESECRRILEAIPDWCVRREK